MLSIDLSPEPLSRRSLQESEEEFARARSRAFDMLYHQMHRYTSFELRGGSILISGHRGAGKTMLVTSVVEKLRKDLESSGVNRRLLLVELHGPSLADASLAGKRDGNSAAGASAPPAVMPPAGQPADPPADPKPGKKSSPDSQFEPKERLLIQIVVNLHQSLIRIIGMHYWEKAHAIASAEMPRERELNNQIAHLESRMKSERVLKDPEEKSRLRLKTESHSEELARIAESKLPRHRELVELAAEFTRVLDDYPAPARLRDYWNRLGTLDDGVIFAGDGTRQTVSREQGFRELLLLASSIEAYRRVSGSFTHTEDEKQGDADKRSSEGQLDLKNLALPIAGILTGGLVGGGALALKLNGLLAGLLGLLTAILTASGLKFTGSRSYDHTLTRSSKWDRDLTVKTLDRELRKLIDRFLDANVFPIFLIDEMDKVRQHDQFEEILKQLKVLFSERAFFCFAADREYYDALLAKAGPGLYPTSATLYRQKLYVVYLPEDFHAYLMDVLVIK